MMDKTDSSANETTHQDGVEPSSDALAASFRLDPARREERELEGRLVLGGLPYTFPY